MHDFDTASCTVSWDRDHLEECSISLHFQELYNFLRRRMSAALQNALFLSLHLGLFLGAKKGDSSVEIFVGRSAQNKWTIIMDSFGFPLPPVVHYGCCPFDFSTEKRVVHFRIGNREGQKYKRSREAVAQPLGFE